MQHISTTPFGGRTVSAGLMAARQMSDKPASVPSIDKWQILQELTVGKGAFGLTDRDLGVLNALISFHQSKTLTDGDQLVVFPSNKALAARAHGMAESTLRRHLGALVNAGIILRQDSPNGKRYASKDGQGAVTRAFGFDLRPLLVRADEIADAAETARLMAAQVKQLREDCSLVLRDAWKLAQYGATEQGEAAFSDEISATDRLYRILRRKLPAAAFEPLLAEISKLLASVQAKLGFTQNKTEEMDGSPVQTGRQFQNSNKDSSDFEPALEKEGGGAVVTDLPPSVPGDRVAQGGKVDAQQDEPPLPLVLVRKACPDISDYALDGIATWTDLINAAHFLRPMLGISEDAWWRACSAMGHANAAIVLAGILQRSDQINAPGGYLRALTTKAEDGAFSPAPMIMALLNTGEGRAA